MTSIDERMDNRKDLKAESDDKFRVEKARQLAAPACHLCGAEVPEGHLGACIGCVRHRDKLPPGQLRTVLTAQIRERMGKANPTRREFERPQQRASQSETDAYLSMMRTAFRRSA